MKLFNLFSKNKKDINIRFELKTADYCPEDLPKQLPLGITVLRQLPGLDTPNYWLARCDSLLYWAEENRSVNYLIVGCRFAGAQMVKGAGTLALNVAYVTDESLLKDDKTSFDKCAYVAVCTAEEIK